MIIINYLSIGADDNLQAYEKIDTAASISRFKATYFKVNCHLEKYSLKKI